MRTIAKNFVVSQNEQPFLSGSNFINKKDKSEISRSFSDVMNELLIKNNSDAASKTSKVSKSASCDSAVIQKRIESAVKWLANYLGIKPSFLLAVFSELGIDPNDMADKAKFYEIIQKLSEHFNLDEEQKKEIVEKMGGILGHSF
jgi:hypothetical protein